VFFRLLSPPCPSKSPPRGAIPPTLRNTALDGLSSRDKFRINPFITVLDTLETNPRKRTAPYSDIAKQFCFLTNLTLSKQEVQQEVPLLMKSYPEDVDLKLTDEILHFHMYVRQSHKSGLPNLFCVAGHFHIRKFIAGHKRFVT